MTAVVALGKRLAHEDRMRNRMVTGRGDPRGYYAALGLPLTANAEDIRRAFNEQAKQLHPDHAGGGSDPAAFQRILDAYEVLRDPSRRLRYDADSVRMRREEPAEPAAEPDPDPLARSWAPTSFWSRTVRSSGDLRLYLALAGLGILLAGGSWWQWGQRDRLRGYEDRVSQLTLELERARSEQAEAAARYRAASEVDPVPALRADEPIDVFATELDFPAGAADAGPELDAQLLQAIRQVSAVVERIPADRRWLVLIQGQAVRAAGPDGVAVADWQAPLVRVGQVLDRLVAAGLPADRVAMRFSAGFVPEAAGADPARVVELRVVCCLR